MENLDINFSEILLLLNQKIIERPHMHNKKVLYIINFQQLTKYNTFYKFICKLKPGIA
jgi:hypothetical protein